MSRIFKAIAGVYVCSVLAACSSVMTGSGAELQGAAPGLALGPTGATDTSAQRPSPAPTAVAAASSPAVLPRCDRPIDTIALVENPENILTNMGLTSPLPILRLMISQSNCFTVVDRGAALAAIEAEHIRTGQKGGPKVKAARYFLTPQIVFQNSGSTSVGGAISSFMGNLPLGGAQGVVGTIAANINQTTSEAQTVLFLTDGKTGTQVAAAQGSARTSEVGFSTTGMGSLLGSGGAYAQTDTGKTAMAALVDAYANLVRGMSTTRTANARN